ncbi:MAG: YIP1 family protein [Pseudomonadota bacterium]
MAATRNILATYRAPMRVVQRIVAEGQREDRAIIYLLLGCILVFVAQLPRLARQAYFTGEDLSLLLGGTLMAWIFIMPVVLYAIGWSSHLIARLFGSAMSGYAARIALFWALLASTPIVLLWGLTAGFIGPGVEMTAVGLLWLIIFIWFWGAGLIGAARAIL